MSDQSGVEEEGYGERGVRLPSRLEGLQGDRRKLPQWGLGQSPRRKRVLVHLELETRKNTADGDKFDISDIFASQI